MDPTLIAMIFGTALKAGSYVFDQTEQRKAAIMRDGMQRTQQGLEENMRRLEGQQTQVLSSTRARMAGTGFASSSGSFENYMTEMSTQFGLQNTFKQAQGQANIEDMQKAADLTGDNGFSKWLNFGAGLFGGASSVAGAAKIGG